MKICSKCGVEKAESEFYIRTNGKLRTECKDCNKLHKKEYGINFQLIRCSLGLTIIAKEIGLI